MNQRTLISLKYFGVCSLFILAFWVPPLTAVNAQDDLKARVPADELAKARALKNPFEVNARFIEKGRMLYEGRAFCSACHGRDGKGKRPNEGTSSNKYPMPRNFTNGAWQAARSDGEIFWILKNGSHGTDMASFLPQYVSEKETWQLVAYLRSFQGV